MSSDNNSVSAQWDASKDNERSPSNRAKNDGPDKDARNNSSTDNIKDLDNPNEDNIKNSDMPINTEKMEQTNRNDLLKFPDNYSSLMHNLGNDNLSSQTTTNEQVHGHSDKSTAIDLKNLTSIRDSTNVQTDSNKNQNNEENLDMLFQHYQSVLSKSESDLNHHNGSQQHILTHSTDKPSEGRSCIYCSRNRKQCIYVPDLGNCIECELKRLKCTFEGTENNDNNKRSGEESSGQFQTKRAKISTKPNNDNNQSSEYYSNFLQSLNTNISTPGSQQYDSISPGTLLNSKVSNSYNQNDQRIPSANNPMPQNYLKQQQQIQYPRSSFYVGPTSIFDISILNCIKLDNIDQIQISKSISLRKVAPNVEFLLRDDYNKKLYMEQEQQVDLVERLVYPHGKLLVEIFFKLIHPYFPILHERVFLEKYSRSYRELTTPLLAAIYSLALQWWDFHPKLIGFAKPDVVDTLNDIAFKGFFERIERPKLSMIQTGLLILQCRSESPNNWVLCSNVVALAEELGLGVSCQDWKLPKWEKDLRKRLAWAVWSVDKWTSLIEGRHSHLLLGRNWMVNILKRDDFPSSSPSIEESNGQPSTSNASHSPNGSPVFNIGAGNLGLYDMSLSSEDYYNGALMFQQMVSLSIIVGEIMDTFYTQGAIHVNTNIEQVLKLAKPLQLKLREWYHSLPPHLSMNNFVPKKFNSNASLTLIYFAAEITLHRKIISSLTDSTPKELVQVCRTAARTRLVAAIEFIGDLKSEHINAFWYSCSTGNLMLISTFAALLYVTAPTKEETIVFRDLMRNYIWVLRVRSKSFDKLKHALNNIHMLLAQIPGLLTDDEPMVLPLNQLLHKSSSSSLSQAFKNQPSFRPPIITNSPSLSDNSSQSPNRQDNSTHAEVFHSLSNVQNDTKYNSLNTNNETSYSNQESPASPASVSNSNRESNNISAGDSRTPLQISGSTLFGDRGNNLLKSGGQNKNMSSDSVSSHRGPDSETNDRRSIINDGEAQLKTISVHSEDTGTNRQPLDTKGIPNDKIQENADNKSENNNETHNDRN